MSLSKRGASKDHESHTTKEEDELDDLLILLNSTKFLLEMQESFVLQLERRIQDCKVLVDQMKCNVSSTPECTTGLILELYQMRHRDLHDAETLVLTRQERVREVLIDIENTKKTKNKLQWKIADLTFVIHKTHCRE